VEAMQITRLLNLHRISGYEGLNLIEIQLRRNGFGLGSTALCACF
jgi:hypothetical protein